MPVRALSRAQAPADSAGEAENMHIFGNISQYEKNASRGTQLTRDPVNRPASCVSNVIISAVDVTRVRLVGQLKTYVIPGGVNAAETLLEGGRK